MIGVDKAWAYMRGAGVGLSDVKVGVVDTGVYRGNGQFNSGATMQFFNQSGDELSEPARLSDNGSTHEDDPRGSHGTMVCGLLLSRSSTCPSR
jgi:subtilisin family serine protease